MPIIKCNIDRRAIESGTKKQRELGSKITLVDPSGLRLAINSKSASWNYNYRKRGVDYYGKRYPQKTLRLGDTVSMSVNEARLHVEKIKAVVRNGGDPAEQIYIEAAQIRQQEYLRRPLSEWLQEYKLNALGDETRHKREEYMHARKGLAELNLLNTSPADLTARELRRLTLLHAEKQSTARHRFGAISRFLDYLLDEEVIVHNVAKDVSRQYKPKAPPARETFYDVAHLKQLWYPKKHLRQDYQRFVRFMIVCPLRMSEAAELTGKNIFLDHGELRLSSGETKNSESFTLPLPTLALIILSNGHIDNGLRCFQLSRKQTAPMVSWSYFNKKVRDATGVSNFNLHNFRRTFSSLISEHSDFSESLVDSLLNHKRSQTRQGVIRHYQHAKNVRQRREVMEWWNNFLEEEVVNA